MSFYKKYTTIDLSAELANLSDDALMMLKQLCGDDFRLYDLCDDILEARLGKEGD